MRFETNTATIIETICASKLKNPLFITKGFLSLLIASLLFSFTPVSADTAVNSALTNSNPPLTGKVYYQGSVEFAAHSEGYQKAANYSANQPFAIVYPKTEQDIQNAIRFCIFKKIRCSPRGGGHGYEAYSSTARNGLIIDMKEMNDISFEDFQGEKDGVMTAGAGNLMWQLYEALGHRWRNVPLATGPTVGVAGLVTAGGVGITSRKYGTTCEHVMSMRVVTGTGEILEISRSNEADLFAALCGGGGGNAAIITTIKFKTHPIAKVISFEFIYDWKDFVQVVDAYQKFMPYSDYGLTGVLALVTGDGFGSEPKLKFYGQFTPDFGSESTLTDQFNKIIKPMEVFQLKSRKAAELKPLWANRVALGFNPLFPGAWEVRKYRKQQIYKSTSSFQKLGENIPVQKLEELKKRMEAHPALHAKPSQPSMIQLLSGGLNNNYRALGFYQQGETRAPSEILRAGAGIVWQYDGYWTDVLKDQKPVRDWVVSLRDLMNNYTSGAYMGYMDANLKNFLAEAVGTEWAKKMGQLALQFDPNQIFKDPQGWHAYREAQTCSEAFTQSSDKK